MTKPKKGLIKINEETLERVFSDLRMGFDLQTACASIGIKAHALEEYRKKHPEVQEKLEQAQAEGERGIVGGIRKHGVKDWRALAWMAERKYPKKYGARSILNIAGEIGEDGKDFPIRFEPPYNNKQALERIERTVRAIQAQMAEPDPED